MNFAAVFEANLSLIERAIARVCRKTRLVGADAEDFASAARLFLIDDDYAVLRRHDEGSSLEAYLAVVLHRFLIDERNRERGRWRPSAEAQRMGVAGVLLEKLLRRDRRSMEEAFPLVRSADQTLTTAQIEAMASRLPDRVPRLRPVPLGDELHDTLASRDDAAGRVIDSERRQMTERAGAIVRAAIEGMPGDDRMLMKLRFGSAMSISDIARMLRVPQRPLYRRIETLLGQLRATLARAGIDASAAAELGEDLDFGIRDGKTEMERLSLRDGAGGG